ncbi:DUF1653 domain-containing protein [Oceanobacillus kimchii]|uniref:DUF1653 domain-containing protein n=1 Tax=Oceanobacillus kimchii TaxID=746691 RepID=UPI003B02CC7A
MGEIYRHYKGDIYNVIGMGKHTETSEELAFYEDAQGRMWARPMKMFMEQIEVNGTKVSRFQYLGTFYK